MGSAGTGKLREVGSDLAGQPLVMVTIAVGDQYILCVKVKERGSDSHGGVGSVFVGCWSKGATNCPKCRQHAKGPELWGLWWRAEWRLAGTEGSRRRWEEGMSYREAQEQGASVV